MLKYQSHLKPLSRKLRNSQTDAERKLWKYLRKNQIAGFKFTRQKPIHKYIVDFYCHKLKLIIEIDGDRHYGAEALEKDRIRDAFFKDQGLQVIRIGNYEIYKNIEGVVRRIWNEIELLD